jgi:hypothetical protein
MVYGRCATPQPCVGFLGDSIMTNGYDQADPITGALTLGKALRNQIPFINISQGGDSCIGYLARHECRDMFLRDPATGRVFVTDLVLAMGRNEMSFAAGLQINIATITKLWVARGVRVIGWTVTPQTTSIDKWATTANQTVSDVSIEAQRLIYNTWLRANYASIGMTRIIDAARIVDPTDSGKWRVDGTPGYWGLMVPTMSGRRISAITRPDYNGAPAFGREFPANQPATCTIYPMPGDTGAGGGAASLVFGSSGEIPATATVIAGGDYDFPPMIVVPGAWTGDGLHPGARGYQEIIYRSGFSPAWFGA